MTGNGNPQVCSNFVPPGGAGCPPDGDSDPRATGYILKPPVCVSGKNKSDSKLLPRNRHEVCAATGSVAVFEVCAGFIDPEGPKSFVESRLTRYVAY